MNKTLTRMMTALLVFELGAVSAQERGTEAAVPQPPAAIAEAAIDTATAMAGASSADTHEPITGAFGIQLGERFDASMVEKVVDEEEHGYRGSDGAEQKGTLYRVVPRQPDKRYQHYSVKTTGDGIIYAIQADYKFERKQSEDKQENASQAKALRSTCKAKVRALAKELEGRHGKPRGQGWHGEWYVFRQSNETADKSLRLFGHRCRSGLYYAVYTDEAIKGRPNPQQ